MYVPKHFEENREEEIKRIIENYPLATLVGNTKNGIVANHIPLLLYKSFNSKKILIGHIARANKLHEELKYDDNVMVIFKSEDAYISPNWYPTRNDKKEHVPTWNYQSVHLYGKISFNYEKKFLLKTVKELTNIFENSNKKKTDWKMSDVSSEYMSSMLNEIVGFEISVSKQIAKSKLSQNREKEDIQNVKKELKINGYPFLSNSMNKL
ncbi:FMN-binding negative transcriptional regulator [Alphaproteobacteria bacterium]|nr:FMN-binding negative transcriptional regulator [Alphaproteobacteria bacterium]